MPKLTVLLGRKTLQVHDIDKPVVRIGRDEEMDVIIDNPSVSRKHLEIRQEGESWVVEDLGSSNGTFMAGKKLEAPHGLAVGDEIGLGKFSIVFGKVVGDGPAPSATKTAVPADSFEGTTHIKAREVEELLKESERKRRAQIQWESGGRKGTHYLSEAPGAIFGTSDLCDVRVPRGPKNHVVVLYHSGKCEVRYLGFFGSMKVGGSSRKRHVLQPGESAEVGGMKLTFEADMS